MQRGVRPCPRTESLKWLAEHPYAGEAPFMAFGHYIREALVSEQGSDEKREKPFTLSQRFLTLLRAEQLLALAGGQDQKKIKSVPSHTPQQRSTF